MKKWKYHFFNKPYFKTLTLMRSEFEPRSLPYLMWSTTAGCLKCAYLQTWIYLLSGCRGCVRIFHVYDCMSSAVGLRRVVERKVVPVP